MRAFSYGLLLVLFWTGMSAQLCTKEIVYGKDYITDPFKASYTNDRDSVLSALQKALEVDGFQVLYVDEGKEKVETGWKPVGAETHYVDLFQRPDYGLADGSYYQLLISLDQAGPQIQMTINSKVKTIVGPLKSNGRMEKKILAQVTDYLRPPLLKMTNVETKNR